MNFSEKLIKTFREDVNKTMASMCRMGALLMILVIVLNLAGIFVVDAGAYPVLGASVVVMLMPTLYYDILHYDNLAMRYVFLAMSAVMCGLLYMMFSYQVAIMLVFPVVMSCMFCNKGDVLFTQIVSVPVIVVSHLAGYWLQFVPTEPAETLRDVVCRGMLPRLIEFFGVSIVCFYITDRIKKLVDQMVEKNDELMNNEQMLIESLTKVIELQSEETGGHVRRVSEYTRILCEALEMEPDMVWKISTAAMMHDVGKLYVPIEVQEKPDKLTDAEYEEMKKHVLYAEQLFANSSGEMMEIAKAIALQHHERYDGKGYLGIKGEQIDFNARCVAIADVFDALVSRRAYKKAWKPEEAKSQILSQKGRQFDPELVDIFAAHFDEFLEVFRKFPDAQEVTTS